MERQFLNYLFVVISVILVTNVHGDDTNNVTDTSEYSVSGHDKMVVCYWGTWANYRPVEGKFTPESVDGSLCTHLIYSFAGLDTSKWAIKSLDTWMDLETDYGLAGFKKATDLRNKWRHLKVMIAIGGWNEGSTKYSQMAKSRKKRSKFVKSAVEFLKKYNFDGLDLDWEYPGKRGGSNDDKKNFILLAKELKEAFAEPGLLLSAAIGAGKATIDISYDVPNMYKYLDFVNVMCYDYHGRWDKQTGHNAPLRARPNEDENNKVLNDEFTINYLMELGAVPEKTNLGIPLYGRAFLLKNSVNNNMGDEARASAFSGPITREEGFLGYNEICSMLTSPESQWSLVWEKCHQAPYMFNDNKWVSYDNERSIRLKADFAWAKKLGGVMVWSIETDDFKGLCGDEKYPMMRALNNALVMKSKNIESDEEVDECTLENYATERTIVTLAPRTTTTTTETPVRSSGSSETESDSSDEEDYDDEGSADDDTDDEEEATGPCHNPNGPNPDPEDCSQFYLCAGAVPHLMTCRDGTLYSASLMTCDHAANVDCQVKKKVKKVKKRPTTPASTTTAKKTTTIVTLSTVTSTLSTLSTTSTTLTTSSSRFTTASTTASSTSTTPITTTTSTTKKYERQTEKYLIPIRINPGKKEEDIAPLLPVDNNLNEDKIDTRFSNDNNNRHKNVRLPVPVHDVYNDLDHQDRDHKYEFSKTDSSSDVNQEPSESEGMGSESVAIIVLVFILLVVILVFMWCFRAKIKDYTETYLDKIASDRIRKPSTVSLLKAYQLNKIKFPSYSGKTDDSSAASSRTSVTTSQPSLPKLPPKDYSNRDLPPLPLNERAPIAPPRRKKSFSENLYESPTSIPQGSPNGTTQTLA